MFLRITNLKKLKENKTVRFLILLLISIFIFNSFGIKTTCEEVKNKVIFVVGDSRTCSLVNSLKADEAYNFIYTRVNEPFYDAIIKTGKNTIVIFGESGGYLKKGSLDRSLNRMAAYISNNPSVWENDVYFFDLYGLNDIIYDKNNRYKIPGQYIQKDRELDIIYPQIIKKFHFNIGPVSEDGLFYEKGIVSNPIILNYNSCFCSDDSVDVVDFYSYMLFSEYETLLDIPENNEKTGIHYDLPTDFKIMKLILALSQ